MPASDFIPLVAPIPCPFPECPEVDHPGQTDPNDRRPVARCDYAQAWYFRERGLVGVNPQLAVWGWEVRRDNGRRKPANPETEEDKE